MTEYYSWQGNTLKLSVNVVTGSKHPARSCLEAGRLKLHLKSRPIDNCANQELIQHLAKSFAVPKSSISLLRGHKSSLKTLLIQRPRQSYAGVIVTD